LIGNARRTFYPTHSLSFGKKNIILKIEDQFSYFSLVETTSDEQAFSPAEKECAE
jgi:hypothetical protein